MNVTIGTKCRREGVIFWAHPDCKGEGPWCDWAMFHYLKTAAEVRERKDCKIGPDDAVHSGDDPTKAKDHNSAKCLHFLKSEIGKSVSLCFVPLANTPSLESSQPAGK